MLTDAQIHERVTAVGTMRWDLIAMRDYGLDCRSILAQASDITDDAGKRTALRDMAAALEGPLRGVEKVMDMFDQTFGALPKERKGA